MAREEDYTVFCKKFEPNLNEQEEMIRYWDEKSQQDLAILQATDNKYIWTVIEGNSGKWYIVPGWHIVNREFYIITKNPWEEGQKDYLYI